MKGSARPGLSAAASPAALAAGVPGAAAAQVVTAAEEVSRAAASGSIPLAPAGTKVTPGLPGGSRRLKQGATASMIRASKLRGIPRDRAPATAECSAAPLPSDPPAGWSPLPHRPRGRSQRPAPGARFARPARSPAAHPAASESNRSEIRPQSTSSAGFAEPAGRTLTAPDMVSPPSVPKARAGFRSAVAIPGRMAIGRAVPGIGFWQSTSSCGSPGPSGPAETGTVPRPVLLKASKQVPPRDPRQGVGTLLRRARVMFRAPSARIHRPGGGTAPTDTFHPG